MYFVGIEDLQLSRLFSALPWKNLSGRVLYFIFNGYYITKNPSRNLMFMVTIVIATLDNQVPLIESDNIQNPTPFPTQTLTFAYQSGNRKAIRNGKLMEFDLQWEVDGVG